MVKKLLIVVIGFFISVIAFGAKVSEPGGLQDGFILRGVDGEVSGSDSNNGWLFKFNTDVNDGKDIVKAGASLELLPSATLEKITADINERASIGYRLWGRVTRYKGRNFIFPMYFLPLSKIDQPAQSPQTSQVPPQESAPSEITPAKERELAEEVNEPNDVLSIPQEVLEKLKTKRIAQPTVGMPEKISAAEQKPAVAEGRKTEPEPQEQPEFKKDAILADRTALLVKQDDGRLVFVLDALGLNAPQVSLQLLPCEALERTEQTQSVEPEPVSFKIAGIMTKYKGKYYLLLQKATRAYGYGNFGR
jgi:hypothetical protein